MDEEGRNTEQEVVLELPNDIVTEIRLRLPVKSFLRFKTACKQWYSIITSAEFIKKHLNLARDARYNQHKNFLGLLIPDKYASYPCVLYKEDSYGIMHAQEFDFPYKLFVGYDDEVTVRFCNSCDGLICFIIATHHRILIWNPSLPTDYKIIQSQYISATELAVMGYDRTSDDYKIVKVSSECLMVEDYISVEIFSLKSNSWTSKRITKRNSVCYSTQKLIYANNGVNWIATECYAEDEETDCIVYFDLAEESLDYMNLPSKSFFCLALINYKESIAIAGEISEGQHELWVLEEYCGMKSSWNKISSFKFSVPLFFDYSSFTLNGEILVHKKGRLSKYDTADGSLEHVVVQCDNIEYNECSYSFYASPYVESLVSPRQLQ